MFLCQSEVITTLIDLWMHVIVHHIYYLQSQLSLPFWFDCIDYWRCIQWDSNINFNSVQACMWTSLSLLSSRMQGKGRIINARDWTRLTGKLKARHDMAAHTIQWAWKTIGSYLLCRYQPFTSQLNQATDKIRWIGCQSLLKYHFWAWLTQRRYDMLLVSTRLWR